MSLIGALCRPLERQGICISLTLSGTLSSPFPFKPYSMRIYPTDLVSLISLNLLLRQRGYAVLTTANKLETHRQVVSVSAAPHAYICTCVH